MLNDHQKDIDKCNENTLAFAKHVLEMGKQPSATSAIYYRHVVTHRVLKDVPDDSEDKGEWEPVWLMSLSTANDMFEEASRLTCDLAKASSIVIETNEQKIQEVKKLTDEVHSNTTIPKVLTLLGTWRYIESIWKDRQAMAAMTSQTRTTLNAHLATTAQLSLSMLEQYHYIIKLRAILDKHGIKINRFYEEVPPPCK